MRLQALAPWVQALAALDTGGSSPLSTPTSRCASDVSGGPDNAPATDKEEYSMKRFSAFVASALLAVLVVTAVYAQQPGAANDPHHPAPPAGTPATPPPMGSKGGDMMDMCRQMMTNMMGMPMMGGSAPADPKEKADMLQMRGEMMKAMGDIMMKHARRMQGATSK
jgi:hypothetical protein